VLLARYFERMKTIVERHGGRVEKFIGDAVMAVFGVPALHEDDALRAVRAASEMRDALPGPGLEGRIGVMTGEVVTGTEERLATGDAVVDHMHIVVAPILLGRGARRWEGLEGLEKDYQVESASAPRGVTHVTFTHVA
jgi:hypothetical protein